LTTESIFSESAIKALDRNLSAFSTLFAPGNSWDNVRSTTAPYTESRLAHLVRNKRVGFPVVEQQVCNGLCSFFGNWKMKKWRRFVNTSLCVVYKGAENSSRLLQVKNDNQKSLFRNWQLIPNLYQSTLGESWQKLAKLQSQHRVLAIYV
jgi:hypothetical protein